MRSTKENARKWGSVFSVQYLESRSNASTLHTLHGFTAHTAGAGAGAAARCWRVTILQKVSVVNRRGISATFNGVLIRSGGTSLRNVFNRASPASDTVPP